MRKNLKGKARAAGLLVLLGLVSCSPEQAKETAAAYIGALAEGSREALKYSCFMDQSVTDQHLALFNSLDAIQLSESTPRKDSGGMTYGVHATAEQNGEARDVTFMIAKTDQRYELEMKAIEAGQLKREPSKPTREQYSPYKYCITEILTPQLR